MILLLLPQEVDPVLTVYCASNTVSRHLQPVRLQANAPDRNNRSGYGEYPRRSRLAKHAFRLESVFGCPKGTSTLGLLLPRLAGPTVKHLVNSVITARNGPRIYRLFLGGQ